MLVFLEASVDAFYEPARKALLPSLVPRAQLPLAATIDSTVWSVVTTFATGLGGAIATTLGMRMLIGNHAGLFTCAQAAMCAFTLMLQRCWLGLRCCGRCRPRLL